MKFSTLIFLALLAAALPSARAQSKIVPSPETAFDRQVLDTFLGRGLDDTWDISGEANKFNPGLPVAIHFSEWGAPIDLGDAVQQRSINQPFELIVGFYEKLPNSTEANVVAIYDIKVDPEKWNKLWGKVTVEELKKLQASFKTGSDRGAMFYARGEASRLGLKGSTILIDPKIRNNQRLLNCCITFALFHREFLGQTNPQRQQGLTLWNKPFKSRIVIGNKVQETVVANIDKNGRPIAIKNEAPAAPPKKEPDKIAVTQSKTVLKDPVRVDSTPPPENAAKASPAEIEAAIKAAQEGKITPATPGVIPEKPDPLPTLDTGWSRIDIEPVKIK